ncbi:MAG: hypothetical protein Q7T26_06405 [Dehalococcoidia bacterium]|nr:hypothetical protein [Dehalococcoidia bacterium]
MQTECTNADTLGQCFGHASACLAGCGGDLVSPLMISTLGFACTWAEKVMPEVE